MTRYRVFFEADILVDTTEAGFAEEAALAAFTPLDLYCSYIEVEGASL